MTSETAVSGCVRTIGLVTGKPPLNLFGIAFGLAGLAGTWTTATAVHLAPEVFGDLLWIAAGAVWLTLLVRYFQRPSIPTDLEHPVLGPFAALVPATGLLFGGRLAGETLLGGRILIGVMLVVGAVYAGWFLAHLLSGRLTLDDFHPGYLLPTVAAGLIAAQEAATVGWSGVAMGAFGVGVLFWGLTGAALLARLVVRPLAGPILPTMAIFAAPPAVAGNAWFVIDGGSLGGVAQLLLGTMVVVLLLQAFVVPAYGKLPFSLGFWALTFTTAASATYGVHWLAGTAVPGWKVLAWVAVGLASGIIGTIAVASVRFVVRSARGRHHVVPIGPAVAVERATAG